MNRHTNTAGSTPLRVPPHNGVAVGQPQAAAGASAANLSTGAPELHAGPRTTGGACAPNAANPFADPAKPWGRQQICSACNRGMSNCLCGPWPEDEGIPHVDYVDRVMGMLAPGWSRIEL